MIFKMNCRILTYSTNLKVLPINTEIVALLFASLCNLFCISRWTIVEALNHLVFFALARNLWIGQLIQKMLSTFSGTENKRKTRVSWLSVFLKIFLAPFFLRYFFGYARSLFLCSFSSSFGKQGQLCSWGMGTSHCCAFSVVELGAQGTCISVVLASGLSSCSPGLQNTGSIVVVHKLSYSKACGIFADQRSNPCLLHWQADSLPLSHLW